MKIILIILLVLECMLAIAFKFNYRNIQDEVECKIRELDFESYFNVLPNKMILHNIILLILVLLC